MYFKLGKKVTHIDKLVNVFNVNFIPSDSPNKVHQPERSNDPVILELVSIWQFSHVHQQLQEQINRVEEVRNTLSELIFYVGRLE